jgi:glutamate decarboxylase
MTNLTSIADFLTDAVLRMSGGAKFIIMSKGKGEGLPVVAWRLREKEYYDGKSSSLVVLPCLNY